MPDNIFIRHGKKFYIISRGMCHYEEVRFVWLNHRTFYKLSRDQELFGLFGDKLTPRKEYFDGMLINAYVGWQNCFIEFYDALATYENFPTEEEFKDVAEKLRLKRKIARIYIQHYKKFFQQKKKGG
jgi:hypothetical protein